MASREVAGLVVLGLAGAVILVAFELGLALAVASVL
jgi:hypothetical protein